MPLHILGPRHFPFRVGQKSASMGSMKGSAILFPSFSLHASHILPLAAYLLCTAAELTTGIESVAKSGRSEDMQMLGNQNKS